MAVERGRISEERRADYRKVITIINYLNIGASPIIYLTRYSLGTTKLKYLGTLFKYLFNYLYGNLMNEKRKVISKYSSIRNKYIILIKALRASLVLL